MGTEYSKNGIGMGSIISEEHLEFLMDGGKRGTVISGMMASTARDSHGSPAHTPTTRLRKGLVCARLTASPYKFSDYLNGEADGRETAHGILMDTIDLLDANATAQDAQCRLHVGGWYDEDQLHGIDAAGKVELKAKSALFKEDWLPS